MYDENKDVLVEFYAPWSDQVIASRCWKRTAFGQYCAETIPAESYRSFVKCLDWFVWTPILLDWLA